MIGQVVGGYTIVKALGSGDRGDVYLAEHRRIHRRAAIRVLPAALTTGDPDAVSRFFDEARALSTIRHPGIEQIHDADLHDGRIYVVTDLLEGESLAAVLDRAGNFASEAAAATALGQQIAAALAAAHARGIAHRELSPANVLIE